MKKITKIGALTLALLGMALTEANADEKFIRDSLTKSMAGVKLDSIKPSPVKDIYEVAVGTNIFYVSGDARYVFQGSLTDVHTHINLTEEKLSGPRGIRKQMIDKVGNDKMITFKAPNSKYTITVFTDIDCGYCKKFHSEIDQYLAEGITVKYLFFPRAGKESESYKKAVSVWCAKDRNAAYTASIKGESIPPNNCANPIDEHMLLVESFGLRGTPTVISDSGKVFPGYLPAKQLALGLAVEKQNEERILENKKNNKEPTEKPTVKPKK